MSAAYDFSSPDTSPQFRPDPAALLVCLGAALPLLACLLHPGLDPNWSCNTERHPIQYTVGTLIPGIGLAVIAAGVLGMVVRKRLPLWGLIAVPALLLLGLPPLLAAPGPGSIGCGTPLQHWLLASLTLTALCWGKGTQDHPHLRTLARNAPLGLPAAYLAYALLPDAPCDMPLLLFWWGILLPWLALGGLHLFQRAAQPHGERG